MVLRRLGLLALVLLLLPVGIATARSSPHFVMQRSVMVGGGTADSANFSVTSVVGQPATDVASSANYRVSAGFLLAGPHDGSYRLRLPLIFR